MEISIIYTGQESTCRMNDFTDQAGHLSVHDTHSTPKLKCYCMCSCLDLDLYTNISRFVYIVVIYIHPIMINSCHHLKVASAKVLYSLDGEHHAAGSFSVRAEDREITNEGALGMVVDELAKLDCNFFKNNHAFPRADYILWKRERTDRPGNVRLHTMYTRVRALILHSRIAGLRTKTSWY